MPQKAKLAEGIYMQHSAVYSVWVAEVEIYNWGGITVAWRQLEIWQIQEITD